MHSLFANGCNEMLLDSCFGGVINDQTIREQEYKQGNNAKTDGKFVFRFDGAQKTPRDEKGEDEHQEIEQNNLHECDNSFKKMKRTGIQCQFPLYSFSGGETSHSKFVTNNFTISSSVPQTFSLIQNVHRSCSTICSSPAIFPFM